jgi:uncharacterized OB-fold protein
VTDRIYPAPPLNAEAEMFYAAAGEGKFMLPVCRGCGKAHWYPRARCPFCFGEVDWRQGSGTGVIYSYSVMRRVDPPFAIAYVRLSEGPTMMTNIVDCDLNGLAIDQAVRVVFKPTAGGPPIPCFTQADPHTTA